MGVEIPVGYGVCRVMWKPITAPDNVLTTFGFLFPITHTPQEAADACWASLSGSVGPLNQAKFSTRYQSVGVEVTCMTGTGPILANKTVRTTGTGTGSPLTTNTAILGKKNTARGGRKGRGRFFIPGIQVSEIDVDETGLILEAERVKVQITWDSWLSAQAATPFLPVLLHSDGGPGDSITSLTIEPIVATQRRRLRR